MRSVLASIEFKGQSGVSAEQADSHAVVALVLEQSRQRNTQSATLGKVAQDACLWGAIKMVGVRI